MTQGASQAASGVHEGHRHHFDMDLAALIDSRPGVRGGKPSFIGTRITVHDVLEYLAAGTSADEIITEFPELTTDHVHAALEFAALREPRLEAE